MTLLEFKDWALAQGSVAKFNDGRYKGECVSLINQYCWRVLGVPAGSWGHAIDWASNANVLNHFKKVSDVQPGDILVFGSPYAKYVENGKTKYYGHVQIALAGGKVLDQNGSGTGKISVRAPFSGAIAIIRPKSATIAVSNDSTGASEDMIKKGDEALVRIVSTEVKGWPFNEVHNGSRDAAEMAAWTGKDYRKFIWEAWVEGGWYRDLKSKQADFYNSYANAIGELQARPTKAQLDELVTRLAAEAKKVQVAEEALANAPKGGIDKATSDKINETNNIVKQIWDFLTSIFKR